MRNDPVAQLLGTSNKKEQVQAIKGLINLANAPVLSILITFDSRTSRVDAQQIGGEAPNDVVQQILDGAKNYFNQKELARQVELAKVSDAENQGEQDADEGSPHSGREPLEMADATPEVS